MPDFRGEFPRPVAITVAIVCELVAAGFWLLSIPEWLESSDLLSGGVAAEGTVIAVNQGKGKDTEVSFTTRDGAYAQFETSSTVSLAVGDTVPVLYDPSHPRRARVNTTLGLWGGPTFMDVLGGAVCGVGIAVLIAMRKKPTRR
jgi:hypothetical protein